MSPGVPPAVKVQAGLLLHDPNQSILSNFSMAILKLLASTIIPLTVGLFFATPCCNNQPESSSAAPNYIQRGYQVQEHYQVYGKRLEVYYESLSAVLQAKVPALLSLLKAPQPPQHGYQILPRIIATQVSTPAQTRPRAAWYSWTWTEELIENQLKKLVGSEVELHNATTLSPTARTNLYEKLARGFNELRAGQQNIDAHIQYNHLWQAAIAADRSGYDRQTVLYDLTLWRWAIVDVLNAFEKVPAGIQKIYLPQYLAELMSGLREREKLLGRRISDSIDHFNLPPFVRVSREGHLWVIQVPFYTDIDNHNFVESIKENIENIWRLRDGDEEFRVELAITYIPSDQLYSGHRPPAIGDQIDLPQHLARFRRDGAVLTTGALTTHFYRGAIVLGSQEIAPSVLAHEFGHVLGFSDTYIRGYKDLGKNGFQVMEVIADPEDIMGAPESGAVLRHHFDRILEQYLKRNVRDVRSLDRKA
jgi:hypothetical protein